jgi:hypothetical protein
VTYAVIAAIIGQLTGQPVEIKEITPADVRTMMTARGTRSEAEHFQEMYEMFRRGNPNSSPATSSASPATGRAASKPTSPRRLASAPPNASDREIVGAVRLQRDRRDRAKLAAWHAPARDRGWKPASTSRRAGRPSRQRQTTPVSHLAARVTRWNYGP